MESELVVDTKEERFRVSVCLQRYFIDERSRAYVSVVRRRRVRWLQQRLRTLFALRGRFCLRSRGHLLPSEEPLSLLQPDDPIEVIPLSGGASEEEERIVIYNRKGISQVQTQSKKLEACVSPTLSTGRESSVAASEPHETDRDEEALLGVKRQALELLERCGGDTSIAEIDTGMGSATVNGDGPRRTRRRVRRRKRRASVDETRGGAGATVAGPGPLGVADAAKVAEATELAGLAGSVGASVQRNGPAGARKPRLVHSLSAAGLRMINC